LMKFGVPNGSELEPHRLMAKRDGDSSAKWRLIAPSLVKSCLRSRYHIYQN